MERKQLSVQKVVVAVGFFLLLFKFLAFYLTNSNTILTDALESIINVVAGIMGFFSLSLAALPRDENHPYGHGKVEFIAAGIEGTLITFAGVLIVIKSVYSFFYPGEIQQLDLGILITAIAGAVNFLLGKYVEQIGEETHSMTLIASGKHLKSDAYSTLGLIFGLTLLMLTDYVYLDSLMAILFGGLIVWTGFDVLKSSVAGIMDEVDYELVQKIVQVLEENRQENWIDIHNLRVIKYGSSLHVDCHMTIPWYFDTKKAHDEITQVENLLTEKIDFPIEVFIHVDPCVPTSCQICTKENCIDRKAFFVGKVTWESSNVMRNQKHYTCEG